MKTIKINCPFCQESVQIIFDNNLNIYSVKIDETITLSEQETKNILQERGIEIG